MLSVAILAIIRHIPYENGMGSIRYCSGGVCYDGALPNCSPPASEFVLHALVPSIRYKYWDTVLLRGGGLCRRVADFCCATVSNSVAAHPAISRPDSVCELAASSHLLVQLRIVVLPF